MDGPIRSRDKTPLLRNEFPTHAASCSKDSSSYSDEISNETSSINDLTPNFKVYKRRWILVGTFSLLCMMLNTVWNTWGPIAITAENYFGWTDSDIAVFNNWGNINVLIFIIPALWLLDKKGVRMTVIGSAVLMLLSTGLRCISFESPYAIWLMNSGQFLNGMTVIITLILPTMLSSLWFPLQERITALTLISVACNTGVTLSFLIGLSVTDDGAINKTHHSYRDHLYLESTNQTGKNASELLRERDGKDIRMIMYSEFGISILIFIATIAYFPNRPKLPPSLTASYSRPDFVSGITHIVKNKNMWLMFLSTGVTFGVVGNIFGLWAIMLKALNVNQRQSQFMGLYSQIAGTISPIVIGKIADRWNRSLKSITIFTWSILCVSSIVLLLMLLKYIPNNILLIYAMTIIITMSICIMYPLTWELACEVSYPTSEGAAVGLLYFAQNVMGTIFLLLFKVPNIGVAWIYYTIVGASLFGLILFLFIEVRYQRVQLDSRITVSDSKHYQSINT